MGISREQLLYGEGNKWVIATKAKTEAREAEACFETPKKKGSKLLECPPAPRKSMTSLIKNHCEIEFFIPDEDLESVFKPWLKREN